MNKIQALDSISKVEDADAAKVFSDLATGSDGIKGRRIDDTENYQRASYRNTFQINSVARSAQNLS